MPDTSLTVTANAPPPPAPPTAAPAPAHGFFDNLLSELNPLQYVPVVGIIYRAVTGDNISDEAKFAGSLVVSGLTGGPIGIGLNVGAAMLEHMLGIDPEKIGDQILARLGIGHADAKATAAAAPPQPGPADGVAAPAQAASAPVVTAANGSGWSSAQLAAYGVRQDRQGGLARGEETGADVLNSIELAQVRAQATA